jgi:subtilase family serine protease
MRGRWTTVLVGTVLLGAGSIGASVFGLGGATVAVPAAKVVAAGPLTEFVDSAFAGVPTTSQCEATIGIACYSPLQIEKAYDMGPLYRKGLTGAGKTIALVDSYGSPTIASDLATFDQAFGIPAPPSFKIIQPAGAVPPYNPRNGNMVSWAVETTLDVEYSHAMAPGANILLVETPVAETIGVHGFPQIVKAENYIITHHMVDVISQSFAAAEASFPSAQSILNLRSAYVNADENNVTVVSAAGDWGATSPSDSTESTYYTSRAANWPASDPLVTAVGGTQLHLNNAGKRIQPDNVWNDTNLLGSPAAGGGTVSSVFSRPGYQDGVESVVGEHRGIPDISLSAAVDGGILEYWSFPGYPPGFYIVGGTSEATPEFAGIVAVADQAAGHDLGLLNPALYALAGAGAPGIVDITTGNNTVSFDQNNKTYTVPGYVATNGYDLASGLGTVNGADLVAELAGDGR